MDDPKLKGEGKKWIRHFGCAGCHEISGLEDEGRIGTELTTEGSKPIERLDFALLTETAQRGGREPITDPDDLARLPEGPASSRGTTTRVSSNTSSPNLISGTKARSNPKRKSCACPICT